jgi:hypothetical protein
MRVPKYLAGFKRSFVWKDTSEYASQMMGFRIDASPKPSYFPIQYPVLDKFWPERYPQWHERTLNMTTVLRPDFFQNGNYKNGARHKAQVARFPLM